MRVHSAHISGLGWMPCIPFAYNELTGEPISQCTSISDQVPCVADVVQFPGMSYCPSTMPGYPGLGDVTLPFTYLSNDPVAAFPPCEPGSPLPCAETATGVMPGTAGPDPVPAQATGAAPCPAGYVLYGGAVCVPQTSPAGQAAAQGHVLAVDSGKSAWSNPIFIGGLVLAGLVTVMMIRR